MEDGTIILATPSIRFIEIAERPVIRSNIFLSSLPFAQTRNRIDIG